MTQIPWNRTIDLWLAARAVLAEIDSEEHPDVTDRYGRVWTWRCEISGMGRARGRYVHDGCLSVPDASLATGYGLPRFDVLGANPNYAGLCAVCRQDWPDRDLEEQ